MQQQATSTTGQVNAARPGGKGLLAVVALGAFLSTLTSSVINVALPDMARDFGVDPSEAAWFVLSFLLSVTVLLLPAGRVSDLLGHGRMYAVGMSIFAAASLGCAIAPSPAVFIVCRIMQGVGSSLAMASSPALMTLALPPERRGFGLGMMSTATYVGLTVGPPLGGSLVAALGWRSIFWASLVATLVTVFWALRVMPLRPPAGKSARFDIPGSLMAAIGTLAFLLLSTRGLAWGLLSPASIVCAAIAIVLMPVFVWTELRHPAPTLDFRLFRARVFSSATASAMLNYVALFIPIFLIPFALRDGQGMTPQQVGRVLASQALAMALLAWGSGTLSDRIGSRGLATGGMTVLGMGLAGLAWSWPTTGTMAPALWLFVCGAGTGVFISPNSSALMGSAPRERQGVAGGVMSLARNLGMTLGVAVGSGLFASVFGHDHRPGSWMPAADLAVRTGFIVAAVTAFTAAVVTWVGRPSGRVVTG